MCNDTRGKKVMKIIGMTIGGILLAGLFALVFGLLFRELWNWLMPAVFGLKTITYWQAVGLFILAKLLFSGIHGHGGKDSCGHGFKKEFGKEFKKEFHKEFLARFHEGRINPEQVEDYEEFWKNEGEDAFREWLDKKDRDQGEK